MNDALSSQDDVLRSENNGFSRHSITSHCSLYVLGGIVWLHRSIDEGRHFECEPLRGSELEDKRETQVIREEEKKLKH
jgi:hypothetical protein